jgi:cyanate permease
MAFYAGYRLGGVAFPDFWNAMIVLGIGWAIFMPLLMVLAERLDGTNKASPALAGLDQQKLA